MSTFLGLLVPVEQVGTPLTDDSQTASESDDQTGSAPERRIGRQSEPQTGSRSGDGSADWSGDGNTARSDTPDAPVSAAQSETGMDDQTSR